MFIECPKCKEEIDVMVTSFGSQGSYFEPPESGEYDFEQEHPCSESWTDAEWEKFDEEVWFSADESRYNADCF